MMKAGGQPNLETRRVGFSNVSYVSIMLSGHSVEIVSFKFDAQQVRSKGEAKIAASTLGASKMAVKK